MSTSLAVLTTAFIVAMMAIMCAVLPPLPAEAAPAFFVFGDSLVDSGNNNYLATPARADSPPYGLDYPTHKPTGRFSNGLNLPDIISEKIGSERTLPYLSPYLIREKLFVGANFASAGVGILNDTGIQFVNILRIFEQFHYFQQYQTRISNILGQEAGGQLVNKALVLITLGGNDFVNNYFLPLSPRSIQFSLPAYCHFLISEYRKILTRLYELGARRVIVTGTGPMGCVPAELAMRNENGECVLELQRAAAIYNPLLVEMIKGLNMELGSNIFIASNAFSMNMNIISNPAQFGFVSSKIACCGQGPYNGMGQCNILSNLCPDRNLYVFWDAFHPTERANRMIVDQIMTGAVEHMNPMNLSTLMALDFQDLTTKVP
ncbi:hypothetical protein SLA2020_031570 [Shorea laevis]